MLIPSMFVFLYQFNSAKRTLWKVLSLTENVYTSKAENAEKNSNHEFACKFPRREKSGSLGV